MENKTRQEAVTTGDLYFFTGKPCKRGHLSKRYVGNGACYECMHPRTILQGGELLSPTTETGLALRSEIDATRLALIERKLSIDERTLALKEFQVEDRSLRLQDRHERKLRQYRASVKKSRLIEVFCRAEPVDYETVLSMIWAFAVIHDPVLRPEDLVKSKLKDKTFIMLCFPDDKEEILRITSEMYDARQGVTKTADMILVDEFMKSLPKSLTMDQKREAYGRALAVERDGQPLKPLLQLNRNSAPAVRPHPENIAKALGEEDGETPQYDPR